MSDFERCNEAKAIGRELISCYHKHLIWDRARVEFLISDADKKTGGKETWGDARKLGGIPAFLAEAGDPDLFPALTFVCALCMRWGSDEEKHFVTAGDTLYTICDFCDPTVKEWDLTKNKSIERLESKAQDARLRHMAGPPDNDDFFVITVYRSVWMRLSPERRKALIDHELCHLGTKTKTNGDIQLYLIPHDLEEFRAVVERHGPDWSGDVCLFADAIERGKKQTAMEFDAPPADGRRWNGKIESITVSVDGKAPVTTTPEALADAAARALSGRGD